MSWLLVACIPGLLMLATFGLERIEASLTRDTISPADVAEFLHQVGVDDAGALSEDGPPRRHPAREDAEPAAETQPISLEEALLPTRVHTHHRVNPQFQPTQHANRV